MNIIRVMSGGAPKAVFAQLAPHFEQASGHRVEFIYAVMTALREKLLKGDAADVLVMPVPLLDGYVKEKIARADGRATLGNIGVSVAVKEGAPRPDIATPEKFRAALLNASAILHSRPGATPSGTHMAKVMEQLGIAEAMAEKIVHLPSLEGGVDRLRKGEADFGIYPTSEIVNVEGLTVIGPLPAELQLTIVYGAAVTMRSTAPEAARGFIDFVREPGNRARWADAGFELHRAG